MRVALVRSRSNAAWQSCVSITRNLGLSYQAIRGLEVRDFAVDPANPFPGVHEIRSWEPDRLAIIDYGSFQPTFLRAWLDSAGAVIPMHLHCFGDFPLAAASWVDLAPRLLGFPIRFIAASDASSELISGLIAPGLGHPAVVPFPIDQSVFRAAPDEGNRLRRSLGISPRDAILLYTGRLSLQKNTTLLARLAWSYARSRGTPLTLAFAGEVDDIGADFLGIELGTGLYRQHFYDELIEVLKDSQVKTVMLGNLDPDGLRAAYNAADLFVSLSMHHDEDFGMSPGEALCCGTPVLLSGWGGFHSFPSHVPERLRADTVRILDFENKQTNVTIRTRAFHHALDERLQGPPTRAIRIELARGATQSLSIPATTRRLEKILREEAPAFKGFSQLLDRLAKLSVVPGRFRSKRFDDPCYRKLYSPYFRPALLTVF